MTRMAHRRSVFARATPPIEDRSGGGELDAIRAAEQAAEREERRRPVWPWVASLLFHIPLFLAVLLIIKIAADVLDRDAENRIVIPTSFTDPEFSSTPGPPSPGNGDPSRDAAQKNLKDLLKSDGWNESSTDVNLATLLKGKAETDMPLIGVASTGGDATAAVASPYGAPTGSGGTFKSTFYGTGGNAQKIVYIMDISGSMLDTTSFWKGELTRSIQHLVPLQFFGVVLVSDTARVMGTDHLQRATPEARAAFSKRLGEDVVPEGKNDELLLPFQQGFEKAFAMQPQLIYFLTDGKFDPRLLKVVKELNSNGRVKICTIAYFSGGYDLKNPPDVIKELQDMAEQNNGIPKVVLVGSTSN